MTWAAAWALLRRFWPAVPVVLLSIALVATRATLGSTKAMLAAERAGRKADTDAANLAAAQTEARWAVAGTTAAQSYASRLAAREPIILRSTDTVRTYAQTDAGRAACLAADRVRGIDALDADLFTDDPARADRGEEAVRADTGAAPSGR